MIRFNLREEARGLPMVTPSPCDVSDISAESLKVLATFNQLMVGVVRFQGETPWERHPDDEFIQVIEGQVTLVYPEDTGREVLSLSSGDICVVPKCVWHRQVTEDATIMFMTSQVATDHMPVTEDLPTN